LKNCHESLVTLWPLYITKYFTYTLKGIYVCPQKVVWWREIFSISVTTKISLISQRMKIWQAVENVIKTYQDKQGSISECCHHLCAYHLFL
jgi:hypothetical protein